MEEGTASLVGGLVGLSMPVSILLLDHGWRGVLLLLPTL
jgi:hypothetical protein